MTVERPTPATHTRGQALTTRAVHAAWTAARLAGCAGLVALAACASPPSRFYTLGAGAGPAGAAVPANPALLIEVAPVDVPSQVAKNQIVVQTSPSQVDVLEQERWASPPGDELRRALSGDLSRQLDTIDVYGTPHADGVPVYRVSVNVQRFESWPGSQAVLDAVWSVRAVGANPVLTCRTVAAEPVGPGFDALVAGHRRAVGQLSAQIAAGVRTLAAAHPARNGRQAATSSTPLSCPPAESAATPLSGSAG
jgi:uncharacterized lipoprotein YmbA